MVSATRAIETEYQGYRFRSRLEARWAVFFNTLGIEWEYEKEGYDLNGTRYLPDFWLPEQNCWIEIKGADPTPKEARLAGLLAEQTRKRVYIFFGPIPLPIKNDFGYLLARDCDSAHIYLDEKIMDMDHWWCECRSCRKLEIQWMGLADRMACAHHTHTGNDCNYASDRLIAAYAAARQARFEHGEMPR